MSDEDFPTHRLFLADPGPRPPFFEVVDHVWGDRDVDTDGNSSYREATDWTELYMAPRPEEGPVVEVFPFDDDARVLCIASTNSSLMRKTADFLLAHAGGSLTDEPPSGQTP